MLAAGLAGAMAPNPTVVSVCELKKMHCRNRSKARSRSRSPDSASGPSRIVNGGKQRIDEHVAEQDPSEELRPRNADQMQIRVARRASSCRAAAR